MTNIIEKFQEKLLHSNRLHVRQVWESWETFLGWESRNKYEIEDPDQNLTGFAAEQSSGLTGTILRQILGHWRSFRIFIFDEDRQKLYDLDFPFRWFLKTLYVRDARGKKLGHLEERWAFFRKKFDVYDRNGRVVARINSSFFKFWTFDFKFGGRDLGTIQKNWSGALNEFFTDKDNFMVTFADEKSDAEFRVLMLATCLMVDIVYFEKKSNGVVELFD